SLTVRNIFSTGMGRGPVSTRRIRSRSSRSKLNLDSGNRECRTPRRSPAFFWVETFVLKTSTMMALHYRGHFPGPGLGLHIVLEIVQDGLPSPLLHLQGVLVLRVETGGDQGVLTLGLEGGGDHPAIG